MSVIVSKRKISHMQFYKTARDLRRDITKMLEQMFSDESKFCYSCKFRKFKKKQLGKEAVEIAYKTWCGYWKSLGGNPRRIDYLYRELFGGVA